VAYDTLVLATGSDAVLPSHTPGHDANGVFVYRTISDLERLIDFSSRHQGEVGVTVGGGLLGLEAAKAMMDLESFGNVKLVDRNQWVLARQLDADAGSLVTEKIRDLGLDVLLRKQIATVNVDDDYNVVGVTFEDGESIDCCCICFAVRSPYPSFQVPCHHNLICRRLVLDPETNLGREQVSKDLNEAGLLSMRSRLLPGRKDDTGLTFYSLETSVDSVYAIGECASWENQTFGIIAPGIEMADVLSFNLTRQEDQSARLFKRPDLSTKLKLLGVEVASFGDFFADRDGPKFLPGRPASHPKAISTRRASVTVAAEKRPHLPPVKALTYKDPFGAVYKKYLFTMDGKHLLGGMMIGDTRDYIKLNQMVKTQKHLDTAPSEFILGVQKGGDNDIDDL
jgi:nitrite reductase (NAD(P)H)